MAHPARSHAPAPANFEAARLLAEARQSRDEGNVRWAEALARRARCYEPGSVDAAQLQCELLLSLGRSEQALAIAEQFAELNCREMLITQARALCDLQRWDDAQLACDGLIEPPAALTSRIRLAREASPVG